LVTPRLTFIVYHNDKNNSKFQRLLKNIPSKSDKTFRGSQHYKNIQVNQITVGAPFLNGFFGLLVEDFSSLFREVSVTFALDSYLE